MPVVRQILNVNLSHATDVDIFTFFPPFAGVLLAFAIQWTYTGYKNRERKGRLMIGLNAELKFVMQRLREHDVKRIHKEGLYEWLSGVNTGTVLLLAPDVREKIGRMYFAIDNYNYEAEIVRRLGDECRQAEGTPEEKPRTAVWTMRSQLIFTMESNLSNSIESLLKEDFWPKS